MTIGAVGRKGDGIAKKDKYIITIPLEQGLKCTNVRKWQEDVIGRYIVWKIHSLEDT